MACDKMDTDGLKMTLDGSKVTCRFLVVRRTSSPGFLGLFSFGERLCQSRRQRELEDL